MTSAELNKLAERVEALQGPCRETNWAAMDACGVGPRDYTGSIDAAATLVPEGHWWEVGRDTADDSPLRNFGARNGGCFRAQVEAWSASVRNRVTAATPALALCAAALRARAAIADADGGK